MINIAALTAGINTPSSRFRIRQHIEPLKKYGFNTKDFIPFIEKDQSLPGRLKNLRVRYVIPFFALLQILKLISRLPNVIQTYKYNITWLEREILPGFISLEPFLKRPLIIDIDDAIWTLKPFGKYCVPKIVKKADLVIAGNSYLANWLSKYSKNIKIIPTAIDTACFVPKINNSDKQMFKKDSFIIGWTGLGLNLVYLYEIESAIKQIMDKYNNIELCILSDQKPEFKSLPSNKVHFIKWNEKIESKILTEWDIGIMPLPDNEFTRGKCSFKMLQYMAAGLPVVVSPIGMNKNVLQKGNIGFGASKYDEWIDNIEYLYKNKAIRLNMGNSGRMIVKKYFDRSVISKQLADIFLKFS